MEYETFVILNNPISFPMLLAHLEILILPTFPNVLEVSLETVCTSVNRLWRKESQWQFCDAASQTGQGKPDFETLEGEPIFPPEEEKWWLTEVERRVPPPEDKANGDEENGPASDLEEQRAGDVKDDDPMSSEGEAGPQRATDVHHAPQPGWRNVR